jgi:hypothetical protein
VNDSLSARSRFLTCAAFVVASVCSVSRTISAQEVMDQKSVIEVRVQYLADLDTLHARFLTWRVSARA